MEIYNDDLLRFPDCAVEAPAIVSWVEQVRQAGALEKLKPSLPVKLLGTFSPRKTLEAVKKRAADLPGSRAALVCISRDTFELIFLWSDSPTDDTYRLAGIRANGFVLGVMQFYGDGILYFPEEDPEEELKRALLGFYANCIQHARYEQKIAESDTILKFPLDINQELQLNRTEVPNHA
jgi:hypothetical protein